MFALTQIGSDWEQVFANIDVDGDGALSLDELELTFIRHKLVAKEERLYNLFLKLDQDRSVTRRASSRTASLKTGSGRVGR